MCACRHSPRGTDRAATSRVSLRRALVQVSISDFRQIAQPGDRGKKERLFRAAIAAFCSLTRPSRNEIAKLEDLTLPLYEGVSIESLRFVAAALSEVEYPPLQLVKRLAGESVDIAAPLLVRSPALRDVDLIALIGRHGIAHARVIGRRPNLNPTIADLVKALNRSELRMVKNDRTEKEEPVKPALATAIAEPAIAPVASPRGEPAPPAERERGRAAEAVRDRLRAMMRPADDVARAAPVERTPAAKDDMPDWVAAE